MNITDISGIGDATAQRMKAHGFESVEDVAQASIERLAAVPGIGEVRAAALRDSARGLLPEAAAGDESRQAVQAPGGNGTEDPETAAAPAGGDARTEGRKDGKGKKDKKKSGTKGKQQKGDKKEKKKKKKKKKEKKDKKSEKKGKGRGKKKNKRQ